jgi:hypothetical protein
MIELFDVACFVLGVGMVLAGSVGRARLVIRERRSLDR